MCERIKFPLHTIQTLRYCVYQTQVRLWRNGRRAALRSLWGNSRGGSSPLSRTKLSKIFDKIQLFVGFLCILYTYLSTFLLTIPAVMCNACTPLCVHVYPAFQCVNHSFSRYT